MTTIVISDRATSNAEVIKGLRSTADLLESLLDIGGAKVVIEGNLAIRVEWKQAPEVEPTA